MARKPRPIPEINAGSMADIAFLLLIFFLVTTTMDTDTGITIKLPPLMDQNSPPPPIKKRNVFDVLVNSNNQLLVRGELANIEKLREMAKKFITNNGKDPLSSDSPDKAIISLKNDRGTNYGTYINVQNELKGAYRELRDEESMKVYGRKFEQLTEKQQNKIKAVYPQKISEAEPENFGTE